MIRPSAPDPKVKDFVYEIQSTLENLSTDNLSNLIQAHFTSGRKLLHHQTKEDIELEIQTEALLVKDVSFQLSCHLTLQLELKQLQEQLQAKDGSNKELHAEFKSCQQELKRTQKEKEEVTKKLEVSLCACQIVDRLGRRRTSKVSFRNSQYRD